MISDRSIIDQMENNLHNDNALPKKITEDFRQYCRDVPDFPKKGIIFKDITTLLKDGSIFKRAIDALAANFSGQKIDTIACIDARGFLIGAALAYKMGCGLVPIRKKGKLPWKVKQQSYDLEYGQDTLEIHEDAFKPGSRVLIVDDVLATGGTAAAVAKLITEMQGEIVGIAFLMELKGLQGRQKLPGIQIYSLMDC
jgi:adenine phosphoribosyltransferase